MNIKKFFEIMGNGIMYVLTFTNTKEVFECISLILSIIISILIIGSMLYTWWEKAKADGKITSDEIKEGIEIIKKGKEEIEKKVNSKKED